MYPQRYDMYVDAEAQASKPLGRVETLSHLIGRIAQVTEMELRSINTEVIEPRNDLEAGGISVQGLITTSHIAIHTWPTLYFFMFDLVSCKPFDPSAVLMTLEDILGLFTSLRSYQFDSETGFGGGKDG